MDQSNKKVLTMSFIGAGAVFALIVKVIVTVITPITSGTMARAISSDFVVHILPVALGFVLFLILQFNKKINIWADEVVTEIKKVVWPSRKDTIAMTIVVCIMVMISALIISVFDFVSSQVVNYIVSL